MRPEADPDLRSPIKPIARVLAVADPDGAEDMLGAAVEFAARHGARLDVISCIEPPPDLAGLARAADLTPEAIRDRLRERRRNELTETLQRFIPDAETRLHLPVGKAFVSIIRTVLDEAIDMVIKTAEPLSGFPGVLFASTDQHLLRKCPCPVWLRLPETRQSPRTILAAVDVNTSESVEPDTQDDVNRRVLETALQIAAGEDATIHVLHAWDAPAEGMIWAFSAGSDPQSAADRYISEVKMERRRALDALITSVRERAGPTSARFADRMVRGAPRTAVADEAKALAADALVIGTVARTGLRGIIIGNTAEDILNTVGCSVIAVKPRNFTCPVAVD